MDEIEEYRTIRNLGISQIGLFCLTFLAALDVKLRISGLEEECSLFEGPRRLVRERREAPPVGPPGYRPQLPLNATGNEMWVHSLSKIQVRSSSEFTIIYRL